MARGYTPACGGTLGGAVPFGLMATETPGTAVDLVEVTSDRPCLTVVFDDECGVCKEAVQSLRRWDRDARIEFVSLRHARVSGRPALERLAAEGLPDDGLCVVDEPTGSVIAGGHAALAIIDALPGGWLLRPWSALPQAGAAAEVVYRLAARHRDTLAWLVGLRDEVHCPTGPAARSGSRAPD
jgi:predicted DCC family thiol-disulfide oxidoreductase YuxK